MSNLYQNLAPVYEAMYHTFIDYKEEYDFYSKIIRKHQKQSLLELGSGTGNLAQYFLQNNFQYLGLDVSPAMIEIAKNKLPNGKFIQGDMRDFKLGHPVESIISTGRTVSYLLKNKDINDTFISIYNNLQPNGILCFDFIDANKFIPEIDPQKEIVHMATYNNTTYVRKSNWSLNLEYGMDINWKSVYFTEKGKELAEIGKDYANVRTFMKNEIEIFLAINGFKALEFIERDSYAFPTYVVVAEKIVDFLRRAPN